MAKDTIKKVREDLTKAEKTLADHERRNESAKNEREKIIEDMESHSNRLDNHSDRLANLEELTNPEGAEPVAVAIKSFDTRVLEALEEIKRRDPAYFRSPAKG